MGNSEVGHMNLGAGRVVYQDLTRISLAIDNGEFAANSVLNRAIDARKIGRRAARAGTAVARRRAQSRRPHHCADRARGRARCAAHSVCTLFSMAAIRRREAPQRRWLASTLASKRSASVRSPRSSVATSRWIGTSAGIASSARTTCWFGAKRRFTPTPRSPRLEAAYQRGENDEFVQPTAVHVAGSAPLHIADGDAIVFMNFRADRARELTRALIANDFAGFDRRTRVRPSAFVTLTHYADDIDAPCAFEPDSLANTFGEYLATLQRTQLRIAETEKYAHVTFFFSGGREVPYPGEDRILIPSPKVATYDLQPEMSAREVTDRLVEAIRSRHYDAIICNFANADMVGHTGIFDAAVAAVEVLDECLGRIVAAIRETNAQCLITADHGNVEQMSDATTGQPHTAHTSEPVPLVYVGDRQLRFRDDGTLADVAPTLLTLLQLPVPKEMTGRSLIDQPEPARRRA